MFQQDNGLAHHARETVALQLPADMPDFTGPQYWPPNSPDLSPVDYAIWGILQERVYHCQICDLTIWKNEWFTSGAALISVSLTEQSAIGDSICLTVSVSAINVDTLNIRFKHCHFKTENKLLLSSFRLVHSHDFVYSLISE